MDNIDRIMKEAERLGFGVSYGKYRAAYPYGSADVLPSAKKRTMPGKATAVCRHCRKTFVVRHGNQTYCSEECQDAVLYQRQKEYYAKKSKVPPVAMCAVCGADFKPVSTKSRYCCEECAKEGYRLKRAHRRASRNQGEKNGISL